MHSDISTATTITTQLHFKNNNTDNKKMNVDRLPVKFSRTHSGGRLQSEMSWSDVPPGRGIWWPRAILHKVNLTFWGMQVRGQWTVRCTSLVQVSGGQEEHYIRSSWLWVILQVRLTFSQTYPHSSIWWPRAVLCQVIMTLGYSLG